MKESQTIKKKMLASKTDVLGAVSHTSSYSSVDVMRP